MTVAELIEALKEFGGATEVVIGVGEEYGISMVELIDEDRESRLSDATVHVRWVVIA